MSKRWWLLRGVAGLVSLGLGIVPALADDDLPRRGMLGVKVETTDAGRLAVADLMPDGPGADAGLETGDLVVSLNGTEIPSFEAFSAAAARLDAGAEVALTVERDGALENLTIVPGERPRETLSGGTVTYGSVRLGDGTGIRTLVTRPEAESPLAVDGKIPGVLVIQGIPCASVETLLQDGHPYTEIISRLNGRGFATLRVEKPGVGDSEGTACDEGGFDREVAALSLGLEAFGAADDIDADRLYAIGISMGGIQAPLVSLEQELAGIVTFGTGVQPWFDYTVNNFRERWILQGQDPQQIDTTMRLWRRYFARLLILGETPEQIAQAEPELVEALKPLLGEDLSRFAGRHYTFHQELDNRDLATAWGRFQGHVLSVHGEFDWVASESDHRMIKEIVKRHGAGETLFVVLDGMDHGFTTHETLEASFENAFKGTPSPAFYDLAVSWLTGHARPEGGE